MCEYDDDDVVHRAYSKDEIESIIYNEMQQFYKDKIIKKKVIKIIDKVINQRLAECFKSETAARFDKYYRDYLNTVASTYYNNTRNEFTDRLDKLDQQLGFIWNSDGTYTIKKGIIILKKVKRKKSKNKNGKLNNKFK